MKKLGRLLFIAFIMSIIFAVSAFASGEPSAEPAISEAAEPASGFDVTIRLNGGEYKTVQVGASVEGNVYTFQISELLDAFGVTLIYDEETDVATLTPVDGGLMAAAVKAFAAEDAASGEPFGKPAPTASDETSASGEPAAPNASAFPREQAAITRPVRNWVGKKPEPSFH